MDELYIEKVLKGDNDSFRYFVKKYKRFAFSLSYSVLKDKSMAEDAVQESFLKAFRGLESFRGNASFQTWFARIVINESLRSSKTIALRYNSYDNIPEADLEDVNNSVDSLSIEERKYFISSAFEQMPSNESLALELFYLKDYSVEEITNMTGWTVSKTKMLLSRGRKSFYMRLSMILKNETKEIF